MLRPDTITSGIASRMLARHGIASIWQLQVAAAVVHRTGNRTAANCILELADAAERELLESEDCITWVRRTRE
jgi:hypothetical protein